MIIEDRSKLALVVPRGQRNVRIRWEETPNHRGVELAIKVMEILYFIWNINIQWMVTMGRPYARWWAKLKQLDGPRVRQPLSGTSGWSQGKAWISPGGSLARRPGTSKRPGHHTRSWVDGREARQVSWASGLCLDTTASQQPPLTTLLYPEIVTVALMSAIVRLMVYFQENRQGMSLDDHHCALSLAWVAPYKYLVSKYPLYSKAVDT